MTNPSASTPTVARGHLLAAVAASRRQRGVCFLNDEGNPKGPRPVRDLPEDAEVAFAPALVRGSQHLRRLRRRETARRDRQAD